MTIKKLLLALTFTAPALHGSAAEDAPLWLRQSSISPDGQSIAFAYKGDIYTVASTGGIGSILGRMGGI